MDAERLAWITKWAKGWKEMFVKYPLATSDPYYYARMSHEVAVDMILELVEDKERAALMAAPPGDTKRRSNSDGSLSPGAIVADQDGMRGRAADRLEGTRAVDPEGCWWDECPGEPHEFNSDPLGRGDWMTCEGKGR